MAISVQLFLVLALCTVFVFVNPKKNAWNCIILCLLLVPSAAQGILSGTSYSTGGVINISLVGYVTIISGLVFLGRYKVLNRRETRGVALCFVTILFIRIIADGMGFVSNKLFDNYLLPMVLAIFMVTYLSAEQLPSLFRIMYIVILIGAAIACVEYVIGRSLLFHDYYMMTNNWYTGTYNAAAAGYMSFRSCSSFGHPLMGNFYYIFGVVYLLNSGRFEHRKVFFGAELAILTLAILSTNARSGLLGYGLCILIYLINEKKLGKLAIIALSIAIVAIGFDWQAIYETLFSRDSSGNSLMVRILALSSISRFPIETWLLGEGFNTTTSLLESLGFQGNLEIAYLIILVENGLFGFSAWIGSIALFYKKDMFMGKIAGIKVASIVRNMLCCFFILGAMSNSFGDPGTLLYLLFILLAASSILSKYRRSGSVESSSIVEI